MNQAIRGVVETGGLSFHFDEAGSGPDVALFLHGFPESRHSWRRQLPHLASLGWRAVAFDQRGYGDSSRPRGVAAYDIRHLVSDVADMFDALEARRRILIAHDWGGAVAWAFAVNEVRPLDALIVLNMPHPDIFLRALRTDVRQILRSWYIGFFQIPLIPELLLTAGGAKALEQAFTSMAVHPDAFSKEDLDHYRANALKPGAMTAMINWYRAAARTGLAFRTDGAPLAIHTPTLLIWGEADTALGLPLTEGYERYVTDFTLKRLPGVSHWVQQEAPDEVNHHIEGFMRQKGLILPAAP